MDCCISEEVKTLAGIYHAAFTDKIKQFEHSCDVYLPYVKELIEKWEVMHEMQAKINELESKYNTSIQSIIGEVYE